MSSLLKSIFFSALITFAVESVACFGKEAPSAIILEYEILREEAMQPVLELDGLYRENIEKIREGAVKAGQLELVVACDAEVQAIGTSAPSKIELRWADLVRVQKIYLENRKSRMTAAQPGIEGLKSAAISKLEDAIVTLTQEEKIAEALKAQELIGQLQAGGEIDKALPGDESASTHFNLEDGSYYGAKIGDSEEGLRAAFSANGLKLFKTSQMSNGSKNISASGINFRINNRGEYNQCYILGDGIAFSGGLSLKNSTVDDFSKLLDKRARKVDDGSEQSDHYEMKTKDFEILLITTGKDEGTVFSLMISER